MNSNLVLTIEELIDDITACRTFAPTDETKALHEKIIEDLKCDRPLITATDDNSKLIRSLIELYKPYISPVLYDRLANTPIFHVDLPICNAVANMRYGRITIYDGLLEVMSFRMAILLMTARVQNCYGDVSSRFGLERDDFTVNAFNALYTSIHFINHGSPLPNVVNRLDDGVKQDSYVAFAGGVLFVLLHELGHLVLGHGGTSVDQSTRLIPNLACVENLDLNKLQEFEADAFSIEALAPEARRFALANVWYVMMLHLDYELYIGGNTIQHPFTINRIASLSKLSGVLDDPPIADALLKTFEQRLEQMRSRLALSPTGGLFRTEPCTDAESRASVGKLCEWYCSTLTEPSPV